MSGADKSPPMRIVSLLPSATEILCAVGAEAELVGISHECDFPPGIRQRRVLTRARIHAGGSSRAIDEAVRASLRDALSLYAVDERALEELAPDVVVTQDLCEVCAVSLDDVRRAVAAMAARSSVKLVSLKPTRLADVWDDVETVAAAVGRPARGAEVRAALQSRVHEIAARAHRARHRPRVVSIEWIDPIMLGGTWMPELIDLAGGIAVGAAAGEPAPTMTRGELAALSPDVVLVKPCGFDVERTMKERSVLETSVLRAVPGARTFVSDGNAFFNRPGPRLVESLEILAACFHPELFPDFIDKHASVLFPVTLAG